MIDRPLNATIIADWRKEVLCEKIPDIEYRRSCLESRGIVTIWPDYDHSVPVWERIFGLGFRGLLNESEKMRDSMININKEQSAFFDGIKITYEAILKFISRLEKQAEKDDNIRLQKALETIWIKKCLILHFPIAWNSKNSLFHL